MIDLRSDTVTRPTPEMLEAMMSAKVGDDVFGEDPTVNALQEKGAKMFGHEAALFCPSGTMTNQIAINAHTNPGDEVICSELAHIYLYEGGGIAKNSGASVRLLPGDRGRFKADQIEPNINADDPHHPVTTLVAVEDTCNKGGGSCYDLEELKKIKAVCKKNNLQLHLDGARVFNSLVKTGYDKMEYGQLFDSISICLSKGLGSPVGSLLIGSKDFIRKAHRIRKSMGGGMRQAGYIAAAGLFALENNIERLAEDHRKAVQLAEVLEKCQYVSGVAPVDTNIVVAELEGIEAGSFLKKLEEQNIKAVPFGHGKVRFVAHLDVSQEQVGEFAKKVGSL
ncbi:threonine aldolase family protein [Halocola ammonii]